MFGFIGKLFGSDKAITKTVDTVSGVFDALHYSEEERAEAKTKAFDQVVGWMEATQGQNLTRRFLAILITCTWAGQYLIAQFLTFIAPWVDTDATVKKMMASAQVMREGAAEMTGAVMLILGFYFAARHLDKIAGAALQRFGKK